MWPLDLSVKLTKNLIKSNISTKQASFQTRRATMLSPILIFTFLFFSPTTTHADFVFNGFTTAAPNLTLDGIAEITPTGLIRLTNDTKQAKGHAFYQPPLPFLNTSTGKPISFSTTFVFAIVPQFPEVSSNGLAFVLSPTNHLPDSMPGQYLGLFNPTLDGRSTNRIVAVELDTVQNLELRDIDDNHVGIDVNSVISLNSKPAGVKLISGDPIQVWVEYNGATSRLDVTLSHAGAPKPKLPLLSSAVNFTASKDGMYVGFSSSTGASTGLHYILGWSFTSGGSRGVPPLDLSKLPSIPNQKHNNTGKIMAIGLTLAILFLLLILAAALVLLRRRGDRFAEVVEDWEVEYGPHRFSYKDLYQATGGFREENLLGAGGFGRVYKGVLRTSGKEVAVKKISHDSRQGMREFVAEIASLGRLRHRNLVQLLGYCRRCGELLLVYDCMPNGSLDGFLHGGEKPTIGWSQRVAIIRGVAAGLLYLHEEWEQVVLHRDVKASNVLLDDEMNGKLSDFGLARLYDRGSDPRTTHVVGTLGYLAPELSRTGKATVKTDVYAFGAFLLEVACGRRPMEVRELEEFPLLVERVLDGWKRGGILRCGDPKLGGEFVASEMEMLLKLGLLCSHPDPKARPDMRMVVQILDGDAAPPAVTPAELSASFSVVQYDGSFDEFARTYRSYGSYLADYGSLLSETG